MTEAEKIHLVSISLRTGHGVGTEFYEEVERGLALVDTGHAQLVIKPRKPPEMVDKEEQELVQEVVEETEILLTEEVEPEIEPQPSEFSELKKQAGESVNGRSFKIPWKKKLTWDMLFRGQW